MQIFLCFDGRLLKCPMIRALIAQRSLLWGQGPYSGERVPILGQSSYAVDNFPNSYINNKYIMSSSSNKWRMDVLEW